jgi:carbamate kinase
MKRKLAVIAIGGNALVPDSDHLSITSQYEKVRETANYIAEMMQEGWNVVITHGNGPQVGMIMRRSELSLHEIPAVPMDYAGADTQGAIGYMFCKALNNAFAEYGIERDVVAIVSQMLVDLSDPAFQQPSKPIGSWFSEQQAKSLSEQYGWSVIEDSGRGWRRVVPSPKPVAIVEQKAIMSMIDAGMTVVTLGGGGIPVSRGEDGQLTGIEAVIDKDMSSALLAEKLNADMLILPTAVEKVAVRFGKPDQRWLDQVSVSEAEDYMAQGEFPAGSMGPKVQALINFVKATGGVGVITTPQSIRDAVKGTTGTHIIA